MSAIAPPLGLLAELTHRCPLGCPYCSNPQALTPKADELDTEAWCRVLGEAADLGVIHVHLSGGEPAARPDLVPLISQCTRLGLYSNLITSAVGLTAARVAQLSDAGLDHVQISVQAADAARADAIAGYDGAFARKREIAAHVVAAGLPLTVNAVLHRANLDQMEGLITLAVEMGARRVELAHAQYYGWALLNRPALQAEAGAAGDAIAIAETLRERFAGVIVVDHVLPDYHATYPKACMGGWGRRILNITPSGRALPCHAAETLPGLDFWSVTDHSLSDIWHHSPAFNAFRGTHWMEEPCRSCPRKEVDFGGCRCQAMALSGRPQATDPVCRYAPDRAKVDAALAREAGQAPAPYRFRR
ncbi:pyrroloquinoline quinone biosynthesis protein PqqE [Aquabacter sp. L1I39]|uniref:pyrroloquinoline quinone biosynthesis protein PqqE n=1 Tax=Aquabacter sp. L1I39 TaxID=2820278 RepID=UPI001ADAE51A|nr:pyrroloquinoline quinone biosynthesis protein PqqE [Aquabacter sp. L1I39]